MMMMVMIMMMVLKIIIMVMMTVVMVMMMSMISNLSSPARSHIFDDIVSPMRRYMRYNILSYSIYDPYIYTDKDQVGMDSDFTFMDIIITININY